MRIGLLGAGGCGSRLTGAPKRPEIESKEENTHRFDLLDGVVGVPFDGSGVGHDDDVYAMRLKMMATDADEMVLDGLRSSYPVVTHSIILELPVSSVPRGQDASGSDARARAHHSKRRIQEKTSNQKEITIYSIQERFHFAHSSIHIIRLLRSSLREKNP